MVSPELLLEVFEHISYFVLYLTKVDSSRSLVTRVPPGTAQIMWASRYRNQRTCRKRRETGFVSFTFGIF